MQRDFSLRSKGHKAARVAALCLIRSLNPKFEDWSKDWDQDLPDSGGFFAGAIPPGGPIAGSE
jgi:hypothetical protein